MNKKELIKEHERLVKVLMKGTRRQQLKEAKKQAKELKEYKKPKKKTK